MARLPYLDRESLPESERDIFDDLMDSNPIFLTGNTDTVYALAFFNLNKG